MKPMPFWLLTIVGICAFLVAVHAYLPFWERMREVPKDAPKSEYAKAYVLTVGESAGRQFIGFFLLAAMMSRGADECNKWYAKLPLVLILGGIFWLSTYTFMLADEVQGFLNEDERASYLNVIVQLKVAAAALAVFVGGFLYESAKPVFKQA